MSSCVWSEASVCARKYHVEKVCNKFTFTENAYGILL